MLDTAASILSAIALLTPGFIVADLSVGRSARSKDSELEVALRALVYALVLHLIFGAWTVHLVNSIGSPDHWTNHLWAISAYVAVVLLAAPVAIAYGISRYLAAAERRDGPPGFLVTALGGGEARDAFDYAYQRWRRDGVYVIVELVGHSPEVPRLVGGIFGRKSAVGQTPEPHNIYLQALCTVVEDVDGIRTLAQRVEPERGVYIAADQIARVDLVPEGPATLTS